MPSKKNCPEGDIGPYRREGVKRIPFFCFIKKGIYLYGWRGQHIFVTCPIFTFVFSISTEFHHHHLHHHPSASLLLSFSALKMDNDHRVFINSPQEKLLEGGGGKWTIRGVNENVPMQCHLPSSLDDSWWLDELIWLSNIQTDNANPRVASRLK